MQKRLLILFFYLIFFKSPDSAHAHDEGPSDEAMTSKLMATVLQRFAAMDFRELPESTENQQRNGTQILLRKKGRVFSLFLGKKHYEFSSTVTESDDVLRLFSLMYLNEARKACSECELPDPSVLEAEIENKLNTGWASRAFISSGDLIFEDFGGLAADVAYRKGFIFAVIKVLGEVAEQFLTGGWHFVCEVVTVAATFLTGPINFLVKSATVPTYYNNSRLLSSMRYISAALVTKSILKRMDFGVQPFKVNDEALQDFLLSHEDKRSTHKVADLTASALDFIRLKTVSQRVKDWSEHDQRQKHRVNKFIQGLESQQSRLEKKLDSNRRLSNEEKEKLKADIQTVISVKRKVFHGKRLKRTFFLFKRRGKVSSALYTKSNDLFKKSDFWYIPMEMEVLNPHLNFTPSDKAMMEQFDKAFLSAETLWLSKMASDQRGILALGKLIDSVRNVFDESLPKRQRQLHARRAGSFVNTVLPENMKSLMNLKLKELKFRKEGFFEAFDSWFTKFSTRRRFSTYFKLLDDYAFYLNFGAVTKGHTDITLNLHMADHINTILLGYGRITKSFNEVEDKESLKAFVQVFDREIRRVKSLEPWRDKSYIESGVYNSFVRPLVAPILNTISKKEANRCISLYQY